ncbi:DUF6898 family protein [Hirschia maritima]|uniref:DUF6898 family protein n=1 Tax=Hirschia maritima TaxID=1121961 RepID=UPI000363FA0B|nr:hypothetical protein [Hirschia maritima]
MSGSSQMYLEFNQVGKAMEVRAVDAGDGLEVSFIAPVNTPEAEITLIARRKLAYVRRKLSGTASSSDEKNAGKKSRDSRRGIVI